jgi:exonuclease SbcC
MYSIYLFTRYSKFEKLSSSSISIQTGILEIQKIKERLESVKKELDKLREETKLSSSKEIEEKLADIKQKIKGSTGQDSLEGLRLSIKNDENSLLEMERKILELSMEVAKHREVIEEGEKKVKVEENIQEQIKKFEELRDKKNQILERKRNEEEKINEIEVRSPGENLKKIMREIDDINKELEELEKTRPDKVEEVTYSEESHDLAKEEASKALEHYNSLKNRLDGNLREIKALDIDLAQLKLSQDNYPILREEIAELKAEIGLMERARQEIRETSRQLRNTVIPHARYIINDILPTITDGRYTDLQISEDLKFQAHSTEAGGYKEQVIFSGGTQDQFLIALRLAFTASILDSRVRADSYSLLMDECISSSDEGRRKGIFDVLEAMRKTFRQIFIIAHEDITENVDYYITMVRNERGYSQIRSKSW